MLRFFRNKWSITFFVGVLAIAIFSSNTNSQQRSNKYNPEKISQALPTDIPSNIIWMANHETGDTTQWMDRAISKPWQDSGICIRPIKSVSDEIAHTGRYSLKMTIESWFPHSGCRQFRYPEARSGEDYYYSAWIYFPEKYDVQGWSNVMQFKAKRYVDEGKPSSVFWSIRLMTQKNGTSHFQLSWKGGEGQVSGPTAQDTEIQSKIYTQTLKEVPEKKWVHLEMFLKQSSDFDGHIIVWQDGEEIYNVPQVRTKFPKGFNSWSVNSYGAGITPSRFTVYVDDAVISTEKIGPDFNNFTTQ